MRYFWRREKFIICFYPGWLSINHKTEQSNLFLLGRPFAAISSARRIAIECDLKSVKQKEKEKKKIIIRTRNFNWQTWKFGWSRSFGLTRKMVIRINWALKRGWFRTIKRSREFTIFIVLLVFFRKKGLTKRVKVSRLGGFRQQDLKCLKFNQENVKPKRKKM